MYDSNMGKTERFVAKTGLPSVKLTEGLLIPDQFILVTYTRGRGEIPESTSQFLKHNAGNMLGVASSGHINWGADLFAKAGKTIAEMYEVPLIHRWTNSGYPSDITTFKERVSNLYVGTEVVS